MTYNVCPVLRPLGTEGDETGATLKLGQGAIPKPDMAALLGCEES